MFYAPKTLNMTILEGEYSIPVIVLSILIACSASYISISMNERIQQNSFFNKSFWLVMASISMGLGIWSMHFIGMSALMLPIAMSYNLPLTILSVIPAIFASYLAFYYANRTNSSHRATIIAGFFMGIGISSMHYIGMAAMKMEANYTYIPWLFIASISISIIVSYAALYIFSKLQKYMTRYLVKVGTAIVMGAAVASMHYTGMAAVQFYTEKPLTAIDNHLHKMDIDMLIVGVTIGISILLLLFALSILLDRYVEYRIHYFNPITLLPNQNQFEKDISQPNDGRIAIVHIHDLEKWASKFGYSFSDLIMKELSRMIIKQKEGHPRVYQIEANRFAIVTTIPSFYKHIEISMENIANHLSHPILINQQYVLVEMVIAISKSKGEPLKDAFANTISILQHSTTKYNHQVIQYNPAIHSYTLEKSILQGIDRAMREDELFLVYQPKIGLKQKNLIGVEALLRWQHPEHGFIPPNVFIPVLEENKKIFEVTEWVIERACKQIASWKSRGLSDIHVSINIPGPYITTERILKVLHQHINENKIDNKNIELEITETSVVKDIMSAERAIEHLRSYGFGVAMDDFGTGVSSLSYLKRLPISTLKVDKSFVDGIPHSGKDSAIIGAIISLCNTLELNVVIEGVELAEQILFFSSIPGNLAIQGYFYSKPLKSDDFYNWALQFQRK